VSDLAIALIAFLAGAELRWNDLRASGAKLLAMLGGEMLLSLLGIAATLVVLRQWIPFLATTSGAQFAAFVMLFSSIAIAHSPSVTVALLSETGAAVGRKARRYRAPVGRCGRPSLHRRSRAVSGHGPAFRHGGRPCASPRHLKPGALLVGGAVGAAVAVSALRPPTHAVHDARDIFRGVVAQATHVETLLTLMTAGFGRRKPVALGRRRLRSALERSSAGVRGVLRPCWSANRRSTSGDALPALLVSIVRVVRAGVHAGARWTHAEPLERRYVWMGLVSQAGVAIGLVTLVSSLYPEAGASMRTMLLSLIAVNQIVGPILFRRALSRAGEIRSSASPNAELNKTPATTLDTAMS
jgi:hypothetical protein